MRRTKIVATIGPASEDPKVLEQLIKAGMNVMRLNFSHGTHEEHLRKVNVLRMLNEKLGTSVAFMLDTKGPEIRTGLYEDGKKHQITKGQKLTLTVRDVPCDDNTISLSYKGLPGDVFVGGHILVQDGLLDFLIDEIDGQDIKCTAQNNGLLGDQKNVNLPGTKINLAAMTEKDKSDLKFAVDNGFDFISASFIRKAQDVIDIKNYLKSLGGENIKIISKIESQEGIDNFDEILKVTDGIMVARGDLGVGVDMALVPIYQKMMIKKTIAAGKSVITATQMLESMQENPRPTRAEVSDVANAVYDETSCVMLSGESAQGNYPLESVATMEKIARTTETDVNYWKRFKERNIERLTNLGKASDSESEFKKDANFAVCCSALFSNATAIVVVTEHGETPKIISSFRPACPIFVITANEQTHRQMSLEFGVKSVYIPNVHDFDKILNAGIDELKKEDLLKSGDTVVLSGKYPTDDKSYLKSEATGAIITVK